ncbi:MAG: translocated intimin receptor Tir [Terriglobia bacterium]
MKASTTKAILTDSQFWVPFVVFVLGIILLSFLH